MKDLWKVIAPVVVGASVGCFIEVTGIPFAPPCYWVLGAASGGIAVAIAEHVAMEAK